MADDPFGDLYIVPMVDIVADIRGVLQAKCVFLPNEENISDLNRNYSRNHSNSSIIGSIGAGRMSTQNVSRDETGAESTLPKNIPGEELRSKSGEGGGGGDGHSGKPGSMVIHNGGGQSNDPNTSIYA